MGEKSKLLVTAAVGVFALIGAVAVVLSQAHDDFMPNDPPIVDVAPGASASSAADWFAQVKPYCNTVEIDTRLRWQPPPEGEEGQMHSAACQALAGRIDVARATILSLPGDSRWRAAGVVFAAGHPAADAGDEIATGPLMELVVEFWPNHYQALYHAGAARYQRGEHGPAATYLREFLAHYETTDGWRGNAEAMLREIEGR